MLLYTVGAYLISGDKQAISFKKAFLSPVLIAFILGIALNLLNVKTYIPEISTYSTHFSNIVTPISMTILGIKMAGVKFGAIFSNARMYFVSSVKLVLMPVLGVVLTLLWGWIFTVNADMVIGFFVAVAMPTAGLASTFADRYEGDMENAVSFTLGTTILSMATIPVLYWALLLIL